MKSSKGRFMKMSNGRFMNSKGVSPLIASVLLIAFTMAVAAILTAWISSFTTTQKEKTAQFEEQVQCTYADVRADPNFARYNTTTGKFGVWVENTGLEKSSIKYLTVEYADGRVSRKIQLNDTDSLTLLKKEGKSFGPNGAINLLGYVSDTSLSGITVTPTDVPERITLTTMCDGVKTSLFKPATGWNTDSSVN